jgi:hypothetical protein
MLTRADKGKLLFIIDKYKIQPNLELFYYTINLIKSIKISQILFTNKCNIRYIISELLSTHRKQRTS